MDTYSTKWTKVLEAIHDRAPDVFPEFQFQRRGPGWVAGSAARIDGSTGKSTGKVYYYTDRPSTLHDFGGTGGKVSVWDYLAAREGLEEPSEIARYLCEQAGMIASWREDTAPPARDAGAEAWEAVNAVCVAALHNDASHAAEAVRAYLKGRNYAAMFAKENHGVLGFFPGMEAARAAMMAAGVDVEEAAVKNMLASLPRGAGTTHPLTIAMHDHRGKLRGLQFRAIKMEHEKPAKYLNSSGMEKASGLYGTSRRGVAGGPVVLVEGVLDAYAARLHGFRNVAAIGGARMTPGQFKAIDELRGSDIYLALDADRAGEAGTLATVLELLSRPRCKIFVVDFSTTGAKDLDALLGQPGGADAWKEAQKKAREAGAYLASQAASQVGGLYADRLSDDVHRAEAAKVVAGFYMAFGKAREAEAGRYLATVLEAEGVRELKLGRGDVMQYVHQEARDVETRRQEALISRFVAEVVELATNVGTPPQMVLKRLSDASTTLEAEAAGRFAFDAGGLYGEEEFLADIASLRDGMRTGFVLNGAEMLLPPGVTVLAAPTGHGKTWALINAMLNAVQLYPDKNFHFFSFEMARAEIALRFFQAFHGQPVASMDSEAVLRRYLQGDTAAVSRSHAAAVEASKADFIALCKTGRLRFHYPERKDVEALAQAVKARCKMEDVGAVFVDYIQRLRMPAGKQNISRYLEIRDVCDTLRDVAVDGNIPLMAAAQFNRDGAKEGIKSMAAEKMADGADIERIASLVVGMHNGGRLKDELDGQPVGPGQLGFITLKSRQSGGDARGILSFCPHSGKIGTAVTPAPAPGIPSNLFTGK